MNQSTEINELATALSKAQGKIEGAPKDSDNPFFKSKYADLGNVITAMRKPFSDNQLSVHQGPRGVNGEIHLVTRIMHSSGQWIEDEGWPLILDKQNMQGLGSACTYARRYGLMAAAGIAPEDDDGNEATRGTEKKGVPYETKADLWGGPLGKTAFNNAMKVFVSELKSCGDADQLLAFLNTEESIALISQCINDKPSWYYGTDSDVVGLEEQISTRKAKLAEAEAEGAVRLEDGA